MNILKGFTIAALLFSISGCTSTSTVESNKSPQYVANIHKLFIAANLGMTLYTSEGNETDAFLNGVSRSLAECGIQSASYAKIPQAQNDPTPQRIAEFAPDTILTITWVKESKGTNGHIIDYLASLYDAQSKSVVWKANITLTQYFKASEELSGALVGRMKKDALISATCAGPSAKR